MKFVTVRDQMFECMGDSFLSGALITQSFLCQSLNKEQLALFQLGV